MQLTNPLLMFNRNSMELNMNTNNIALRAAMVIALGSLPVVASAVSTYAPGNPIVLAREISVAAGTDVAFQAFGDFGLNLSIAALKGRTIDTNFPFEMRLTLTNGANFVANLSPNALTCNYSAAANGTFSQKAAETVLQGAPNRAVFKLPQEKLATESAVCYFTGAITLTSGSKGGDASYDMTSTAYIYSIVSPTDSTHETMQGTVVTFKQAYQLSVTPDTTTINVASPDFSQKFAGGAVVANMGLLEFVSAAGYNNVVTAGKFGKIPTTSANEIFVGDSTITLTGSPLQSRGTVVIGDTPVGACGAAITIGTNAKTASVTGIVSFTVTEAEVVNNIGFCYVVDGATRVSKGTVSFDITTPTSTDRVPNLAIAGDKTVAKFLKNGTSVKVLTIPDPTDVNNPLNIRIYNMGASEAGVYGTLYNAKGELLGDANTTLAILKPNAVKVLKTTDLATLFKVANWGVGGGRAWMQIEGDSQQIRVQSLAKTGGIMVNLSDRVLDDGGAIFRSDSTWKKQ